MKRSKTRSGAKGWWIALLAGVLAAHAGPDWTSMNTEVRQVEERLPWIGKVEVYNRLQAMAEGGNWAASFKLCRLCFAENALYCDADAMEELAARFAAALEEPASAGDPEAQYHLAGLQATGWGRPEKNEIQAVEWLRKSAEAGFAWACLELGRRHLDGRGVAKDEAAAEKWLAQALESNDPEVCFGVGLVYADPTLSLRVRDREKALRAYTLAAQNGHALAAVHLADWHEQREEREEAARWRQRAAEGGHADSAWALAELAWGKEEVEQAIGWARKAAERGSLPACVKLAEIYDSGTGVETDAMASEQWREKARILERIARMNADPYGEDKEARPPADRCRENLREIETAKEMWALEEDKSPGDVPAAEELRYLEEFPRCPAGGTYSIRPLGEDPACSVHGTLGAFRGD